jgi:tripartite-type tricarboxylate transporter receptor subunit TctC
MQQGNAKPGRRAILGGAAALTSALTLAGSRGARAQESYPGSRTVSVILPYAPGGGTDVVARILTDGLAEQLGGTFVSEHKPGATTTLAARHVARARPDGATLLLGTNATFAQAPFALRNLGFDPDRDFAHISLLAESLYLLVANPRWRSFEELLQEAKRRPGQLSYGSWGVGSTAHLLMVDLLGRTGTEMLHVPYNGPAPALTETLAGRLDLMFSTLAPAKPHVQEGRLRALATPARERLPVMPDVPTLIELGQPDFLVSAWWSLSAPAGTPQPVLAVLEGASAAAFAKPAARTLMDNLGLVRPPQGAAAMRERITRDAALNRELMRRAGIELE